MRAEAEVDADAEGEMVGRVRAPDVEAERIGEDLLVVVGGQVRQQHALAGADGRVAEDVVLLRVAHEVPHRRHPADDLVDGVVDAVAGRRCSARS